MSQIDEIRRKYEAGQLDSIKEDLERFIVAHRAQILACRAEQASKDMSFTNEAAIKLYILRLRTINPQREIRDQLEEIEREKWIRGVQSGRPPDAQEVALEWAQVHSAAWRAHWLTTIIYVFERDKDRYLRLLA